MKTRIGFVSNSSSSSFIAIGKTVALEDVKLTNHTIFIGDSICEGIDIVDVTPEILKRIKTEIKNGRKIRRDWYRFFEVTCVTNKKDDHIAVFPTDVTIKKGTEVFFCEQDYHCTEDPEDFVERYMED